jgi:hypothetical protein
MSRAGTVVLDVTVWLKPVSNWVIVHPALVVSVVRDRRKRMALLTTWE